MWYNGFKEGDKSNLHLGGIFDLAVAEAVLLRGFLKLN